MSWYSSVVDSSIMNKIGWRAAANTSGLCNSASIDGRMCWYHIFLNLNLNNKVRHFKKNSKSKKHNFHMQMLKWNKKNNSFASFMHEMNPKKKWSIKQLWRNEKLNSPLECWTKLLSNCDKSLTCALNLSFGLHLDIVKHELLGPWNILSEIKCYKII